MKKAFLFAIALLFAYIVSAQEHLQIKGIPITGNVKTFVENLKSKGFVLKYSKEDRYVLSGEFAGVSDANIFVGGYDGQISKVAVVFPEKSSWSSLKRQYLEFKTSYSEKYGTPTTSYEFFSKPYYEGDGYELQALSMDKCTYFTGWEFELGVIWMQLTEDAELSIHYEDKQSMEKAEQHKNNSIQSDI